VCIYIYIFTLALPRRSERAVLAGHALQAGPVRLLQRAAPALDADALHRAGTAGGRGRVLRTRRAARCIGRRVRVRRARQAHVGGGADGAGEHAGSALDARRCPSARLYIYKLT